MSAGEEKSVEALHSGAIKALKKAVEKALLEHKAAGVPAAIWRDGKVVLLSAHRKRIR